VKPDSTLVPPMPQLPTRIRKRREVEKFNQSLQNHSPNPSAFFVFHFNDYSRKCKPPATNKAVNPDLFSAPNCSRCSGSGRVSRKGGFHDSLPPPFVASFAKRQDAASTCRGWPILGLELLPQFATILASNSRLLFHLTKRKKSRGP
jgi:hypothetical protein